MGNGAQSGSPSEASGLTPPSNMPADPAGVTLRPPAGNSADAADGPNRHRWVWGLLVAAGLLSLAVVFLLPQLIRDPGRPATAVQNPVAAPPSVAGPVNEERRSQAERSMREYLGVRARLELANAVAWGGPDWRQALDRALVGDRLFRDGDYSRAAEAYADVRRTLEALEQDRDQRLAMALDAGHRALSGNDHATASAQYELVLAIDPGHEDALRGLARARVRAEVLRHMQQGGQAETAGDRAAAQEAYAEAARLDTDYEAARAALDRVSAALADDLFRIAMGRALTALEAGRLREVGTALRDAARVRPDDLALSDARKRLAAARRQVTVSRLRRDAATRQRGEDWQAAAGVYEKLLAVQPGAAFARAGLERARDRARLHTQLDHYLADPTRLYSPEPLADAEQLLAAAADAPLDEPRLAEKIATLELRVNEARTPASVVLRSDGQTEVTIYHVGRLGRFQERRLTLRPGTYTVTGSRPGYRDVRQVLSVRPGNPPAPLSIRCEEPI